MARGASDSEEFRRRVDRMILVLFASVIESISWATSALLDQDLERADRVIADDRQVDSRCDELTGTVKARMSETTIGADELEELVGILQMVPELERSADLAEHIAKRTRQGLGGSISPRSRGLIQSMCDACVRMWQLASRAYAERSRDIGFDLQEADDELDDLAGRLLSEGAAGGVDPGVAAELALVARFYERLGDHAVNLSRRVATMGAPRRMSPLKAFARRKRLSRLGGPMGSLSRVGAALAGALRLRRPGADNGFLELFRAATANVVDCAGELEKMLSGYTQLDEHYEEIRSLERKGDQITMEVLRRLDAASATPYDRQDIHALAEELDDVLDDMFSAAELIHLVPVKQRLSEATELTEVLSSMAAELDSLIGCLVQRQGARQRLERIETLERQADAIRRRGLARLFGGEYEALEVLKWKDILQSLEDAANRMEDVSNVVETILVKNP